MGLFLYQGGNKSKLSSNLFHCIVFKLFFCCRYDVWPQGHAPTNYSRWFESSQPYKITWQPNYEPYIAVSRELVPKYDERFFGFGWNKVSHIMELDAQG